MASISELTLTHTSLNGSVYKIDFGIFPTQYLNLKIIVFELVLEQVKDCGDDSSLVLTYTVNEALKFIQKRKCIIYFYCDHAPIAKANRNSQLSNQEFRSKLFNALFETIRRRLLRQNKSFDFMIRNIEIPDPNHGNHFMSLISHKSSFSELEELKTTIFTLNDKD